MTDTATLPADNLLGELRHLLGADAVITDAEERAYHSTDVYSAGAVCTAVIRPSSAETLAKAARAVAQAGYALVPRGGGMSYTGGYTPPHERAIVVDVGALDRILEINEEDMYISVQAGVTWKQIYEALKPRGLRMPWFGTHSGYRATVGGGLSNGALFFGSARYGSAAETVLTLEVVLADGRILKTGQAGVTRASKPFYRTFGPDLTGLFVHDAGALGIKTAASFRLIRTPAHTGFLSFAFPDAHAAAAALSEIGRAEIAEEAYILDPEGTQTGLSGTGVREGLAALKGVVQQAGGLLQGLKEGAKLVAAGKRFVPEEAYSLHLVAAARNEAALEHDLATGRAIAVKFGAVELPNSIPKVTRATVFQAPNGILRPDGRRWAAINAKVAHSEGVALVAAGEALIDKYRARMAEHGVLVGSLASLISNHSFSYELVWRWFDSWLPMHKRTPEPSFFKDVPEPAPNPQATELVAEMRTAVVALFQDMGAASNQIGRTYNLLDALQPTAQQMLRGVKQMVDPDGAMNPGALGF